MKMLKLFVCDKCGATIDDRLRYKAHFTEDEKVLCHKCYIEEISDESVRCNNKKDE